MRYLCILLLATLPLAAEKKIIAPPEIAASPNFSAAILSDGTLYVFIRGLRAKIAAHGERQFLHTARGVGYTLRTEAP